MIGIDTNVLVRHLVDDDPAQSSAAHRAFERLSPQEPGWLSVVVLVEAFWVLRRGYRLDAEAIVATLRRLVDASDVVVDQRELVVAALADADGGADFADALVARGGVRAGARVTLTFDRRAAASLASMGLLDAAS